MAPKISPVLLGVLFLLHLVFPNTIQSKSTGFEFLQQLEGCHKGQSVKGLHQLKRYLEKFGYLNYKQKGNKAQDQANQDEFDELLESAIKAYQHKYRLNVSGSLDNNTVKQMMKPRCGIPDVVNDKKMKDYHHRRHHHFRFVAHYNLFPDRPKWPPSKTHLTYKFDGVPESVMGILRPACVQAFQRWADVTHFTFAETAGETDIRIGFRHRDHGDGSPFDGPFGILAHAATPTTGNLHFDDEENWSANPNEDQVDIESVALHEIGHLLGLAHSQEPNAVMYASFSSGITKRNLDQDDINGIHDLYEL